MDCGNNITYKLDNVIKDCGSIKEEVALLQRSQASLEHEKLKLEEELQRRGMKCEELNGTITRLDEEKNEIRDKLRMTEDMYEKICKENQRLLIQKNELISENERIKQEYSESEDKFGLLNARLVKMEQDVRDLVGKELSNDQTVEELRQKQVEADQVVKELRSENIEATRTSDELMQKQLEVDYVIKELKRENLEATCTIRKLRQQLSKNNMVSDLHKSKDGNMELSSGMRRDTEGTVRISPDLSPDCDTPKVETNGANQDSGCAMRQDIDNESKGQRSSVHFLLQRRSVELSHDAVRLAVGVHSYQGAKMARPSPAYMEIIRIDTDDSDDELDQIPLSDLKNKRVRTENPEDSPTDPSFKEKKKPTQKQ